MTLRERINEQQTVSIDPAMLPVHRENVIQLYWAARKVAILDMSDPAVKAFPFEGNPNILSSEQLNGWRNRYNTWFADLSKEDARALARGLVMSGAV